MIYFQQRRSVPVLSVHVALVCLPLYNLLKRASSAVYLISADQTLYVGMLRSVAVTSNHVEHTDFAR